MPAATVTGLQDLRDQLTSRRHARAALRDYLDTFGRQVVAEIKARCPAESGDLRASVRYEVRESVSGFSLQIHVGDAVADYAGYVEYGTAHEAARPFVRPAINARRGALPSEIAAAILKGLE